MIESTLEKLETKLGHLAFFNCTVRKPALPPPPVLETNQSCWRLELIVYKANNVLKGTGFELLG